MVTPWDRGPFVIHNNMTKAGPITLAVGIRSDSSDKEQHRFDLHIMASWLCNGHADRRRLPNNAVFVVSCALCTFTAFSGLTKDCCIV